MVAALSPGVPCSATSPSMASFTPAWGGWWWMVVEVSELVVCMSVVSLDADQPTIDAHHRVALRNQVLHVNAFTALKEGHGGGLP